MLLLSLTPRLPFMVSQTILFNNHFLFENRKCQSQRHNIEGFFLNKSLYLYDIIQQGCPYIMILSMMLTITVHLSILESSNDKSGPSLKGHTLERAPLYKGHKCLASSVDCVCIWCSLSPKDTSLIRTDFFGRRDALTRGGLLYNDLKSSILVYFPPYLSNNDQLPQHLYMR